MQLLARSRDRLLQLLLLPSQTLGDDASWKQVSRMCTFDRTMHAHSLLCFEEGGACAGQLSLCPVLLCLQHSLRTHACTHIGRQDMKLS